MWYSIGFFKNSTISNLEREEKAMAQRFPPSCPQCGSPIAPGQQFCSNCGATTDANFSNPTARAASGEYPPAPMPDMATSLSAPPPPPMTIPYGQGQTEQQSYNTYYPPQSAQVPQTQQGYQAAPTFAKPQKDATKSVLGQIGCGVLVIILL